MAQQKHHNEYDVEDSHHSSHVPGNKKDNRDFRDFRNMSSTYGKFENPEMIFIFSISVYSIKNIAIPYTIIAYSEIYQWN